jgi:hypothetical protein
VNENNSAKFWDTDEQKKLGLQRYTVKESVDYAYKFLMFQFSNSEDQVISFCTNLSKMLNRETKKQNC